MIDTHAPSPRQVTLAYARVAINRPINQPYTYYVPESLSGDLKTGSLVEVPLRNEKTTGVVVDLVNKPDTHVRIKPILKCLTPEYRIEQDLIELAEWIAGYYYCSIGEALATLSMIGLNHVTSKEVTLFKIADPAYWVDKDPAQGPDDRKLTPAQIRVIQSFKEQEHEGHQACWIQEHAGISRSVLDTMLSRQYLVTEKVSVSRDDELLDQHHETTGQRPVLTPHQQEVFETVNRQLHSGGYRGFLLHGVTGSGKTEVYLRLIEEALRIGRSAIVLVPEIALTPQTVQTFRNRLGRIVGIYHSRQSLGQKFDLWKRIRERDIRVVIGTRSALFVPLSGLGVIIVDEEHEPSYKQAETPRYHARDVAVMRANRSGAVVVLGSATPSIESLHNAREGKYTRLRLPKRVGPHASPVMNLVDLKKTVRGDSVKGMTEVMISPPLLEGIKKRLEKGEQTVLLLNRRGFANHVLCLKCEKSILCNHCDISMTWHKQGQQMLCHWCGASDSLPQTCPACNAAEIAVLGLGTQRIEEHLHAAFPSARVIRVDMDSMRAKNAYLDTWEKIRNHEVDIILGTQMIAKGIHLESVTLVGVISADFSLFLPDFRAAERTYSLLTQVAGRAGRGDQPGEVIVQSFMPHHYAIDMAARLAEEEFYEKELKTRRLLRFPPFARLISILLTGQAEKNVRRQADKLGALMKRLTYTPDFKTVQILGPTPSAVKRVDNQWRWRIIMRGPDFRQLHANLNQALQDFRKNTHGEAVRLTIDVDPVDLL
jgi:primosomal protein N' (replication factor Y)